MQSQWQFSFWFWTNQKSVWFIIIISLGVKHRCFLFLTLNKIINKTNAAQCRQGKPAANSECDQKHQTRMNLFQILINQTQIRLYLPFFENDRSSYQRYSPSYPRQNMNNLMVFSIKITFNPFMPTVASNICCPRDCVSRHNGGTSGAPLKPLRVDCALRALSSLRGTFTIPLTHLSA